MPKCRLPILGSVGEITCFHKRPKKPRWPWMSMLGMRRENLPAPGWAPVSVKQLHFLLKLFYMQMLLPYDSLKIS
jgi:hypothetical protein